MSPQELQVQQKRELEKKQESTVPARFFAVRNSGCLSSSEATPTSRMLTLAPTVLASTFAAALPAQKFPTLAAVTSFGQGETPRASTP